jgi:hypothetical protein
MKSLKLIVMLISTLLVNVYANISSDLYLIQINLNEPKLANKLTKLEIPVVYKIDHEALLKVNQKQISSLEKSDIQFQLLDQDLATNSYHLIKGNDEEVKNRFTSNSIGKLGDYLILKNVAIEHIRDLSMRRQLSLLNLASTQSFIENQYIYNLVSTDINSMITGIIEDINRDSVEFFINTLQQYGTRFMLAPNRFEISEWIYDQFIRFGFTEVEFDTFTAHTTISYASVNEDTVTIQRNVVATLPGSSDEEAVFIVCGHYDSFNGYADPFQVAPGADDDASGTAAVLEMARVIMDNGFTPRRTIKFIAMGAEELMNFGDGGSEHYAAMADSIDMDIRMVINHDMIAHSTQTLSNSTVLVNHHYTSDHFADLAIDNIGQYTQINGQLSDYFGADLGPFIVHGFTGIYFEELEFSPYYHSSDDVIDNYSMMYCTEVVKASCATLLQCITIPTPLQDFTIINGSDGNSLILNWEPNQDYNFDHYKIYVGTESRVYYREETTEESSYLLDQLTGGIEYYVGASVIDSDGYESAIIEQSYMPFYFALDQGILLIDETADGDGSLSRPSDEQVDQYYESLLSHFEFSNLDLSTNRGISLADFGSYSTIIWQADDFYNLATLDSILNELGRYLDEGGNLLYTGYLPCQAIEEAHSYPENFTSGDFVHDYLKISLANKGFATRFSGANAGSSDYFDIRIDTIKTIDFPNQHLREIESIAATAEGRNILFYDSNFDPSTIYGSMIGEPVGVEYIGDDYKAITLTFPLYYMQEDQAKELLEYILNEKFSETLSSERLSEDNPQKFELYQNFPNPFNPMTIINYQLSMNSDVDLSVYNLLGQKVATLVSDNQPAGQHSIQWDASGFASGVYYYILKAGEYRGYNKMVLIR